jgi:N4-(beta-N-acetylglucosaminyl)-L-asparaginase
MDHLSRRSFLAAAGVAAATSSSLAQLGANRAAQRDANDDLRKSGRAPIAIASSNGLAATTRAFEMLSAGADPLDAAVEGVKIVEDDPNDMTVGLGGLPNEEGIVELDASVMHGPMHRAGAVASLRNIKNPAAVAREVARRTDHVLLVGEGALKFAKRMGFQEENLLTEKAREAWLKWRSTLNRDDDWLEADEFDLPEGGNGQSAMGNGFPEPLPRSGRGRGGSSSLAHNVDWRNGVPYTTGTIHLSALDANSNLAGCTTTSGLSWKLPGRVGDSPIIGAGLYTDNDAGSAGATGRGEAVIQICGARTIVMRMAMGDHPTDACLYAAKMIADKTKMKRLLDAKGRPNFDVRLYALRKDGAFGSASLWSGADFAVSEGGRHRIEPAAFLFERD